MENAILSYFVKDDTLHSVCDFNPFSLEDGISIYEVIRIEKGTPLFLAEHLNRFYSSAQIENRKIPYSENQIKQRIRAVISENKILSGNVKFLCYWNKEGNIGFYAWIVPFFYPSEEQYKKGVSLSVMNAERPNPNAKVALYDLRSKADRYISEHKIYEVLYVSTEGFITEGSRSNVFFISGEKLVTPKSKMVLAGITRGKIIDLAQKKNIMVEEITIPQSGLSNFESCFITGTSPKVLPVRNLDSYVFAINHPLLQRISDLYDKLCEKNIRQFSW
ncbi:MAG: aminotransferase class IV [Bacteroidales bacterium]|nr:aminotransferase class IV [Bacteroidales bacterium]